MEPHSLKYRGSSLAEANEQLKILDRYSESSFDSHLSKHKLGRLKAGRVEIMQVNIGKMCNQTCKHCHVDAGPDRKEIMSENTLRIILRKLEESDIKTVDITGGAPEMNPHFKWFVSEVRKLGRDVMNRCNLTIITSNKKYNELPHFFAENNVEVISSLPFYQKSNTDKQRGEGVFEKSINALKMLNDAGYGKPETGLKLNLVYNPVGAFLPGPQQSLENDFKRSLLKEHGIVFNSLYTITNMPISRFLEYLINSGNYEYYMEKLINSFNPAAAKNVMCINTVSIGWDGYLYDCDFNQMLELKVKGKYPVHIKDFDAGLLNGREIVTREHCFGCTAGAGSSCGGSLA
jgi:radical SAM/Cys-rich protein